MGDEPRGDLGLARGRTRPRLVATDAIGWGASMFSQKPVRTSRSARSHVLTRFILLTVAATVTALLSVPAASAAATRQDSSPAGRHLRDPGLLDTHRPAAQNADSGQTTVTATPSVVSGTGPGIQRMVFSLDGQYLLTDYYDAVHLHAATTRRSSTAATRWRRTRCCGTPTAPPTPRSAHVQQRDHHAARQHEDLHPAAGQPGGPGADRSTSSPRATARAASRPSRRSPT